MGENGFSNTYTHERGRNLSFHLLPPRKCFEVARDRGFTYFALRNGWCGGGADAEMRYKMYGKSTTEGECRGGQGGKVANDVYYIVQPKGNRLQFLYENQ